MQQAWLGSVLARVYSLCLLAAHPAEDPLHQEFCILDALRLRQRVRSRIRQGSAQRLELQHPAGLASLRRNQLASLDESGECLAIRDLTSGALLHRWPLPEAVQLLYGQSWTWGSQVLAMTSSIAAFQGCVLLVDPTDGRRMMLDGVHLLSDWSSTGLLLVQPPEEVNDDLGGSDDSEEEPHAEPVRAVDSTGAVVCEADVGISFQYTPLHVLWSPDGRTALLHCSGPWFWLWDVFAGAMPQYKLAEEPPHFNISTAAWSADSGRLIFGAFNSDLVVVWSPQGQHLQATGSTSASPTGDCPPAWGSLNRVAFLGRVSPPFTGQERGILVCRVSSDARLEDFVRLRMHHTHSLCSARALSPDG